MNITTHNSEQWNERTTLLLGEMNLKKIQSSQILIVGLGGVGSYAAEHLVRAGIGNLTIVDGDCVSLTNLNRQLPALTSTIGHKKCDVMKQRLLDINPSLQLNVIDRFILDEDMEPLVNKNSWTYIVDAIDTVSPKLHLITLALQQNIPIISSMGSGGKKDPHQVKIDDISNSYGCHLARTLRKQLHRKNIFTGIKVVYSPEAVPEKAIVLTEGEQNKKSNVGTISYMPAIFGAFCASAVISDIIS